MSKKVYTIVIKVRLDCSICEKKMSKAICCICACELESKSFNEKENTVTITGTFDPNKIMKKICRKAGKSILGYEVKETAKKEETAPKKETAPPAKPATKQAKDSSGEKVDKADNVDKKITKKENGKKKGSTTAGKKKGSTTVTVPPAAAAMAADQGSTKATIKPAAAPKASESPLPKPEKKPLKHKNVDPPQVESKTVATVACSGSVVGAPVVGWCPYGCCYRPAHYYGVQEQSPCAYYYGAQNMCNGQNWGFFSEEDSMCTPM